MADLHAAGAFVVLAANLLLAVAGGVAAWRDAWHEAVRRLAIATAGLAVLQGGIGALLLLGGAEPGEGLHLLYGVGLAGVLPLAMTFASEAPPRARSGVLAVAALTALLLAWRLFVTG